MHNFILFLFLSLLSQDAWALSQRYRLMIRDEPATTICIGWEQASGEEPMLYYAAEDYGQDLSKYPYKQIPQRRVDAKGMDNYFARLQKLRPGTVYYFVIADSEGKSKRYSFRTQEDNHRKPLSIIAGGDSRNHRKGRQSANKMVAKLRPDLILFNGDMTGGDRAHEWKAWFDDWQLTIGTDGRMFPLIVTRGNHEFSNESIVDMFDVPHPSVYFSHTLHRGLLHIVSLNSMMSISGEQRTWLEEDLRQNQDARFCFVQYHHPVRPHTKIKGEHEYLRRYWVPHFEKYGVDLALESDTHLAKLSYPIRSSKEKGHDEGFVRDPNGVVYLGEGGWGAPLRKADDSKSWTRAAGSFNHFSWIFVTLNSIEARVIKTDNADEVETLSDARRFSMPRNIDIWTFDDGQNTLYLQPRKKEFQPRRAAQKTEIANLSKRSSEGNIRLDWQSLYEQANTRYKIQRSTNRMYWQTLGIMHGKAEEGKEQESYSYSFTDKEFKAGGKVYYQILAIDKQGTELYRKQIELRSIANEELPTLLSAIGSGQIVVPLSLDRDANVLVEIKNTKLRSVYKKTTDLPKGTGQFPINVKHLVAGDYLLEISFEGYLKRYNVQIERKHSH